MRPRLGRVAASLLRGRLALGAGLLDSGFASLAGFTGSLYAARELDGGTLGAYALYLSGFMLASRVPQHLLFSPSHVHAVDAVGRDRLAILPGMLGVGLGVTAATAVPVFAVGFLALGEVDADDIVLLGVSAVALSVVSPLQDYLRSTLHLAGMSSVAALVSAAQLIAALGALAALHLSGAPDVLVPFGALVIANVVSMAAGLALVARPLARARYALPPTSALLRMGSALLGVAVFPAVGMLASAALIATLSSARELGTAEAARVVAMPLAVFATGIRQVVRPQLLKSGRDHSWSAFRRSAGEYAVLVTAVGAVYVVIVAADHRLNPMSALVPAAYILTGLVALRAAAAASGSLAIAPYLALVGSGAHRALLAPAVAAMSVRLAIVATLAVPLGAYAIPASALAASGTSGLLLLRRARRELCRPPHEAEPRGAAAPVEMSE